MTYQEWKATRTEANNTNTVLVNAGKLECSKRSERILADMHSKRTTHRIRKIFDRTGRVTGNVASGEIRVVKGK